ncbi:MAG TPA: GNAT family N-acetyltransferase [Cellulomonas sp.]
MTDGSTTDGGAADLLVRAARPDEAEVLAAVAAATFPLACPPGSSPADQAAFVADHLTAAHFAGYLADPAHRVLVAQVDGEVVGYTMLIATASGAPPYPEVAAIVPLRPTIELSKCYVLPDRHGRGVAGALMAATLAAGRESGAIGIWLGVNGENTRAQAFYRRSGFTVAGPRRFQVGGRLEHDLVLHQPLRAAPDRS